MADVAFDQLDSNSGRHTNRVIVDIDGTFVKWCSIICTACVGTGMRSAYGKATGRKSSVADW